MIQCIIEESLFIDFLIRNYIDGNPKVHIGRKFSKKLTSIPEEHQGLIWRLVFLKKNQLYGPNITMRPIMAMIMASSQFVAVIPKIIFNRKIVYNDKAEQNTVLCLVLK